MHAQRAHNGSNSGRTAMHSVLLSFSILQGGLIQGEKDLPGDLKNAVALYASFDEAVRGDTGSGALELSTRFNHPTEKGQFVFEKGFSDKVFKIAKGKGIHGGALEVVDVL